MDGYFSRVKPIRAYHSALHLHLPKIGHFNTKLLHYSRIRQSRVSLLQLLSRSQDNLEDLTKFRIRGNNNLASDIGAILSDTITAITHVGSEVIR